MRLIGFRREREVRQAKKKESGVYTEDDRQQKGEKRGVLTLEEVRQTKQIWVKR